MGAPIAEGELLREFLAERDFACPGCGYNLRNLESARCPECAQELQLTLRLAEPRQGALIAGLVGLSAGAGMNGLLLIYGLIVTVMMRATPSGLERFFVINGMGSLILGCGLLLWLRYWRRIRLASPVGIGVGGCRGVFVSHPVKRAR